LRHPKSAATPSVPQSGMEFALVVSRRLNSAAGFAPLDSRRWIRVSRIRVHGSGFMDLREVFYREQLMIPLNDCHTD
jgi:hypothetical protein